MGNNIEQPREPIFYPNNLMSIISENYDALQNGTNTFEHIEKIVEIEHEGSDEDVDFKEKVEEVGENSGRP